MAEEGLLTKLLNELERLQHTTVSLDGDGPAGCPLCGVEKGEVHSDTCPFQLGDRLKTEFDEIDLDDEVLRAQGWQLVGHIGVDSGQVWIGDPCYITLDDPHVTYDQMFAGMCYTVDGTRLQKYGHDEVDLMARLMYESVKANNPDTDRTYEQIYDELANQPVKIEKYHLAHSFPYKLGHEGAGVNMFSGYGDGTYAVYIRTIEDGQWGERVSEARVVFIGDNNYTQGFMEGVSDA